MTTWTHCSARGDRDAIARVSPSLLEACRLGLPAGGEMNRSLRRRGAAYIRLPRACLSQFLLKEPIPPKNLLYVSPFSSANGDS